MKINQRLIQLNDELGENQAQQLLIWILDCSWSELLLNKEQDFPQNKEKLLKTSVERLKKGEPLAHLRGYQDFYKFRFKVNPHVLIPRPETELLVEEALRLASEKATIMDLGAGSGCIGLSVAKERPQSQVYLFESSEEALQVAKDNGQLLGINNAQFYRGKVGIDSFPIAQWLSKVDLMLANPPYIAHGDQWVEKSVHDFEPHEALYADNNGLEWIHKWLSWSYDYLITGGHLIMEFGQAQESEVKDLAEQEKYQFKKFIKDYSGKTRFIVLSK